MDSPVEVSDGFPYPRRAVYRPVTAGAMTYNTSMVSQVAFLARRRFPSLVQGGTLTYTVNRYKGA